MFQSSFYCSLHCSLVCSLVSCLSYHFNLSGEMLFTFVIRINLKYLPILYRSGIFQLNH